MFYGSRFHQVVVDKETVNYIEFGKGQKPLIILPGLGDGLSPIHGQIQAIAFALSYKQFAQKFKVYMFSRKNCLKEGYSTRDMARDQAKVMKTLGILKADIMGVSQGGMIAQYLAADYPDLVNKLMLVVTSSKQNETIQEVVGSWMKMAEKSDYKSLMIDIAEKSYSEKYLKKYRFFYPLLVNIGKPKDFRRFLIQATSCIEHNSYSKLDKISSPTLIIGGDNDSIVGTKSSLELAEGIKNSELFLYKGLGHATYEEAKDFNNRVLNFLMK
ncbi:alpha/beta hydrolase [Clostridioides difficile]|nr:alpha/beta hydrolase [Clostridioides difficile]